MTQQTTASRQAQNIMIHDIPRPVFNIDGTNFPSPPIEAGIYALLCRKNGSMYVGSSTDLKTRLQTHFGKLRNGVHENYKLHQLHMQYPDEWAWILLEPIADLSATDILRLENGYIKSGLFDLNIDENPWVPMRKAKSATEKRATRVKPPKPARQVIAGVFALTCNATGEKLVVHSKDIATRRRSHFLDLERQRHISPRMQALYNEYGEDGFSLQVLELLDDPQARIDAAQRYYDSGEYSLTIRQATLTA
ncbi:GIY-YIG nuclease family protein [Rhizobium sp. Root482]|uniref:GIY-YIG nuclease family protein n=1 Tax=Rhizobium sp. Root482 TaxID=1736543 RepID=UPI000701665E|nr:GIY-YIG nuclease family protein [Rhizobium sp. Root482]KQY14415.1 hypothetical protein ASD31_09100 [Rhizobium sp. Root482]